MNGALALPRLLLRSLEGTLFNSWSPFSLWPVFAASGWSSPPPCAQIRDPRPGPLWGGFWESPDTDHVVVTDILSGDWDFALSYNSGIFCWRSLEMLNIISYTFVKKKKKKPLRKILTILRKPRQIKV